MAPMFPTPTSPQKRPLSMAVYDTHPAKKQRQFYHRHHTLHFKQQNLPGTEPALFGQLPSVNHVESPPFDRGPMPVGRSQVDDFLDHSIITICKEVGEREGITNASIDTRALEMFRGCVEEYILSLCKYIRRPMLAARRTAPIATDFESAFQAMQVLTPEDQLPPQSTVKHPSPLSLLPTPPPDDFFDTHELPETFLGPDLNAIKVQRRDRHIPSTFPAFPSQHTFRDTAVLPPRERDPRRIRELATEEGRLGEQALRKLAGAVRGEGRLNMAVEVDEVSTDTQRGKRRKQAETMEGMFEETMKQLVKVEKGTGSGNAAAGSDFEMAPIVNSERKYWMPDITRRKPPRSDPSAKTGEHNHAPSEKARGKQRSGDAPARPGDNAVQP